MDSQQHEKRKDWFTAQIVSGMIAYLDEGGTVEYAQNCMNLHHVPYPVQKRVLNRTAVIRRNVHTHHRPDMRGMVENAANR